MPLLYTYEYDSSFSLVISFDFDFFFTTDEMRTARVRPE